MLAPLSPVVLSCPAVAPPCTPSPTVTAKSSEALTHPHATLQKQPLLLFHLRKSGLKLSEAPQTVQGHPTVNGELGGDPRGSKAAALFALPSHFSEPSFLICNGSHGCEERMQSGPSGNSSA